MTEIEKRMASGTPFTFGELSKLSDSPEYYRDADKAIQKWRRRGWISFARDGRNVIWSLTDLGRAEVLK